MLLDEQALFSDDQAITGSDVASTNYINLGTAGTPPGSPAAVNQDIGGGNNIQVLVQVTEAFAGGTNLTVALQTDDNSSFSSAKEVATTGTIVTADLTLGKVLPLTIVPPNTAEKYLRLYFTRTGTFTAGKVVAGITPGIQTNG